MSTVARRVLPLVAIAAITIAASCEPVKKHPLKDTPPGQNIAYYFVGSARFDGTNVTRSSTAFAAPICGTGEASQTLEDDGSVRLSVVDPPGTGMSCNTATGFGLVVGALGDLHTHTIGTTPGSDLVVSQLAFDADGDGNFGGDGTAFGADAICEPGGDRAVPREVGVAGVDDTTLFTCTNALGPVPSTTLQGLKDGFADLAGIDASTPVAIQVAMRNQSAGTNATVDSVTINGVEQL